MTVQIRVFEGITIKDMSEALGVRFVDVIKCLIRLGEEPKTIGDTLSLDSAEFVVTEFNCRAICESRASPVVLKVDPLAVHIPT